MTRRPGRPRAGEQALTRERILAAALRLADEQGLAALTMRRLAGELGVDPMAIYHHLPGKTALVAGLVERVFREMPPPLPADRPWRERVRQFAESYRGLALAHANLVLAIVTDAAAATEAALRISGPLYAALEDAGLTPERVWQAGALVVDYIHGNVLGAAALPGDHAAQETEYRARIRAAEIEMPPAMRRAFAAAEQPMDSFGPGLEMILWGIETSGVGSQESGVRDSAGDR